MSYTGDAVHDFECYSAHQEAALMRMPVCCKCKERIQDDTCFVVNDEVYCDGCMRKVFEVWTEDLMD